MTHIDRSIQPTPGAAPIINLGTPITHSFPNGLTLLIVENHQLPQVGIRLSLDECPELEKEKKGISDLISLQHSLSLLMVHTLKYSLNIFREY